MVLLGCFLYYLTKFSIIEEVYWSKFIQGICSCNLFIIFEYGISCKSNWSTKLSIYSCIVFLIIFWSFWFLTLLTSPKKLDIIFWLTLSLIYFEFSAFRGNTLLSSLFYMFYLSLKVFDYNMDTWDSDLRIFLLLYIYDDLLFF